MDYVRKTGSYDEMVANFELPDVVYKYRDWEAPFNKTIITERQVYFAAPTSFEDPLDCKNPVRYDLLTEKDIYNGYYYDSHNMNQNFTRQGHRQWAREMTKKSPLKDPILIAKHAEETFKEYDERFGVLSLTANPTNEKMWEKYSNDYKGFCVGFDPKIMFRFLGGGGKVKYVKKLPIIMPRPYMTFEEQGILQVYYKLEKWTTEEEYRTQKFSIDPLSLGDRTVQIPAEAFHSIILGHKIPNDIKMQILASIPPELQAVPIYETRIVDDKVILEKI